MTKASKQIDLNNLIVLTSFLPFGHQRIKLLLTYFKSANKVLTTTNGDLLKTGLSKKLVLDFAKHRLAFDVDTYNKRLAHLGIVTVEINSKHYPKEIARLDDAPVLLYLKGNIRALNKKSVAIIGSRRSTTYGTEVAYLFAKHLAQKGVCIVSGLARGIDSQAHKGALKVNGTTVAVVAHGLDTIYPPENKDLANAIVESGGSIISEYPLATKPLPYHFIARNRLVTGMSKAVVVVEGAPKSGTLKTASHAEEQGKSVFAVPGPVTSFNSHVPHFLIKNGALIATSPKDVLDEID